MAPREEKNQEPLRFTACSLSSQVKSMATGQAATGPSSGKANQQGGLLGHCYQSPTYALQTGCHSLPFQLAKDFGSPDLWNLAWKGHGQH
jgi:hypothetical protein